MEKTRISRFAALAPKVVAQLCSHQFAKGLIIRDSIPVCRLDQPSAVERAKLIISF